MNFFKNKQIFKVDKYIRVIAGLLQKLVINEDTLALNRKYLKQVFNGDVNVPFKLVKDVMFWLLEKHKHDYTEDQAVKLLHMLKKFHPLFVKQGNPHLKIKLDTHLQSFIAEMSVRYPQLDLASHYGAIFFGQSEDDMVARRKLID